MSVKHLFSALIATLALTSAFTVNQAHAAIDGTWRQHQAFDQVVSKVIDGPRFTYLLTHARSIRSNSAPYNTATPVLFRIDKSVAAPRWEALSSKFDLSGTFIDDAIYVPMAGCICIVYDNGGIDLIYDDGKISRIEDLMSRMSTEDNSVNQMTPDPNQKSIYVATKCGYYVIDIENGYVDKIVKLGINVQWITRCDDSLVMLTDSKEMLRASVSKATSATDFTPFTFDLFPSKGTWLQNGQPIRIENLMPLTDKTFAYVASGTANQEYILCAARKTADNRWETGALPPTANGQTKIEAYNSYWQYKTPLYHFTVPNRDGYMITLGNYYTQISRIAAQSQYQANWDNFSAAITSIRNRTGIPANALVGSWDFQNFIQYVPRATLTALSVNGNNENAVWTQTRDFGRPNAPLAGITNSVSYIPGYGIATASYGYTRLFGGVSPYVPANLSYYRNGVWTPVSPQLNRPEWAATSSSPHYTTFNRVMESYPTNNPSGLTPDPDMPGMLYCGSITHGITRYDLANPEADILRMSHPKDEMASLPGHVSICPTSSVWAAVCSFSEPTFDNNGTLWTLHNNVDNSPTAFEVWYWTREARQASRDANTDPSQFSQWKSFKVPVNMASAHYHLLHPVTLPGAESILMFGNNTANQPWVFYDHNNTPDDTSDDRYITINRFPQKIGGPLLTANYTKIISDNETGRVWMAGSFGLIWMDPSEGIENLTFETPKFYFRDEPNRREAFFENTCTTSIAKDSNGRKWVGTSGLGVVVISADGKTIEAIFNTSNSDIPSDFVTGIACDLETGIVMISTERGLAEFMPGGASYSAGKFESKVFPEVVLPSNPTPVIISGIPSGCDIIIKNSKGETVRNLGLSTSGSIAWDTLDLEGNRCATDIYSVHAGDDPEKIATIKYLK